MATITFTSDFDSSIALDGLVSSLITSPVYAFAADGVTQSETPATANSSAQAIAATQRSIIFGKKIQAGNLIKMVTRNNWTANTKYSMYDDTDDELKGKAFHVINSSRAVYKCLNNSANAYSTIEPTSLDPLPVELADGYVWQFMYRLTVNQLANEATSTLIPVHEDVTVTANAVSGSVDIVLVTNVGEDYSAIGGGVVQAVLSNTVFQLENDLATTNGMYTNSSLYISSGPAVGQIAEISAYIANNSGKFVTLTTPITGASISSNYTIAPTVKISGDGTGAVARAVMDQQTISAIEVLDAGENYSYATVSVYANNAYGTDAAARAILPPTGGHGSNVPSELHAEHLLVSVVFDGDETATIPTNIKFSQYGLVENVRQAANNQLAYTANTFDNTVQLATTQVNGMYENGDIIYSVLDNIERAIVLNATANTVTAVYVNDDQFDDTDNISNLDGIAASIDDVVSQPDVYLKQADILVSANINTTTRSPSTKETINILLRV